MAFDFLRRRDAVVDEVKASAAGPVIAYAGSGRVAWSARDTGSLAVGKAADLAIWDVDRPALLAYRVGINPCVDVMRGGRWRTRSAA